MQQKTHVVIHHSLTPDDQTVSWEAIRNYHMKTLGWSAIGYHAGIENINGYHEILMGRPMDAVGAHCLELNKTGIGICAVGNYDLIPPSSDLLKQLKILCLWLMDIYKIPVVNVVGHGEVQKAVGLPLNLVKTCPGKFFDLDAFRKSLANGNPYA